MATIVNNPSDSGSSAGWIVAAVVIIALVLVALFVWPGYAGTGGVAAPAGDTTNIDVSIPTPEGAGGDRSGGMGE